MDLNTLKDKAKELVDGVPEDVKEKTAHVLKEAENHIPGEMKEKAEELKDKLGL
jgi:hypothetical protein